MAPATSSVPLGRRADHFGRPPRAPRGSAGGAAGGSEDWGGLEVGSEVVRGRESDGGGGRGVVGGPAPAELGVASRPRRTRREGDDGASAHLYAYTAQPGYLRGSEVLVHGARVRVLTILVGGGVGVGSREAANRHRGHWSRQRDSLSHLPKTQGYHRRNPSESISEIHSADWTDCDLSLLQGRCHRHARC